MDSTERSGEQTASSEVLLSLPRRIRGELAKARDALSEHACDHHLTRAMTYLYIAQLIDKRVYGTCQIHSCSNTALFKRPLQLVDDPTTTCTAILCHDHTCQIDDFYGCAVQADGRPRWMQLRGRRFPPRNLQVINSLTMDS